MQTAYSMPAYGQSPAPRRKKLSNGLIFGIIGGAAGLLVLILLAVVLIPPAIQAARNAARRQSAKGGNPISSALSNVPGAKSAASSSDWQTHESQAGRYSVLMPRRVQTRTQSEPTAVGIVTAYMTMADAGAQGAYFVAYNDMPVTGAIVPDAVLDGACSGAMSRVGGSEVSRESITVAGQPAREVTFEGSKGGRQFRSRLRVLLAGKRMYQVMWVGPPDNEPTEDIQKFFDSFQLSSVVEAPAASADGNPAPANELPEVRRRGIYAEVLTFRRLMESVTQQRDQLAGQGADTTFIDRQLETMQASEEGRLATIAQRNRITREQLDEIVSEGDANEWGKK